MELELGVEHRGWELKSGYGAFNTFRETLVWAPPGEDRGTFGAVEYNRSDGFGENRQGQSGSALVQSVFGSGAWRYRVLGILYAARSDLAGVVRQSDVDSGQIGFFDVYPYPTAQRQNAFAGRALAGGFAEYRGSAGDNASIGLWVGLDNFRLQENFTGFIQRSQTLANVAGRGDLIEQQNRTRSLGLSGRYLSPALSPAGWVRGTIELGVDGRIDEIDQAQNLLDAAVRNQTWDKRVDASILGADLGFYGDLDWRLGALLRLRLGLRGDVLNYEIDDRLGNFVPAIRPKDTFIVGFRRTALGLAFGPRASAELKALDWLSLRGAYGEGYRSPQARQLEDGEEAPYSKVRSADLGLRMAFEDRYQLTVSGYYTQLSDDVAFDAEEGRLERIGGTRRLGAVVHAQLRPTDWLIGALSVTYVHAQLLDPPPPTAEEPEPPFQSGQSLPFVPPIVVRLDLGARSTLVHRLGPWDLTGHLGLGYSFLSPRPLPFGTFADPVSLLDASGGIGFGPFALDFEVFNILDTRYAASEFTFASSWDPEGIRTRTPAIHLAAGSPRAWLLTLGVSL